MFGSAARGDYKTGSDIDVFIAVYDKNYNQVNKVINKTIFNIRQNFKIVIDVHLDTVESLKNGNTYYDPSFISHLTKDCPSNVKFGIQIDKIMKSGWTTKEAINARIRLAKLNLSQLKAGLEFHKYEQDNYYYSGIEKLFSRVQHTTRNILYLVGEIDKYKKEDHSKLALVDLYLYVFKNTKIHKDLKTIINTEKQYYKILNKTIKKIEDNSITEKDKKIYMNFILSLDKLIPYALNFFDYNLNLINGSKIFSTIPDTKNFMLKQ